MTDIPLRWVGTDATGAAASSVKKNIDSVGKAASGAQGGVKGLTDAMSKMSPAGKSAQGALSGMESAAKSLLGGLGGVAAAMGVGAVVGFGGMMIGAAVDMGKAAEASDRLRSAMDGLAQKAGSSSAEIISKLQQASGGAIAEYDLMLAANKSMMLGVASSADDMGKLMEIARARGDAMGLSATQAFNDLVTGLGRGSALILDNLGIVVDAESANAAYAESIGKTVKELTEQEKKQALVNATLKEATGAALPAASSYERMAAAMADMKVELGALFAPAISAAAEMIAQGIGAINERVAEGVAAYNLAAFNAAQENTMQAWGRYLEQYNAELAKWEKAVETFRAFNPGMDVGEFTPDLQPFSEIGAAWSILERQANDYNEAAQKIKAPQLDIELMKRGQMETTETTRAMQGLAEESERVTGSVSESSRKIIEQANSLNAVESAVSGYVSGLERLMGGMARQEGVVAALSMLDSAEAKVRATVAAYEAMGWSQERIALEVRLLGEDAAASWQAMLEGAEAAKTSTEGYHAVAAAAAETTRGLGVELHAVQIAGWGAKSGIDAAALSAASAEGSFWGLVMAARETSEAMRQAQIDASGNRLESTFLSAAGTLGSAETYDQYQRATAGLAMFADGLRAMGIPLEQQKFMLEEYTAKVGEAVRGQVDAVNKAAREQETAARKASGLGGAAGSASGKLSDLAGKAGDLSGKFQSILDQIPGLKGTSEVTDKQMSDASLGIPQNFADDYLRRLTDEVLNGVDWAGVDIGDAAQRAGIDPSLPAQTILAMFKNAWADSSLFANPANLDLINMDAVKAGLTQANNAQSGKANIDALFGIGDDATIAAVASLGLSVQSGLSGWLSENGMPDAGAKLAAALGAGVSEAGIPLDGGLQTWSGSDEAKAAAEAVAKWLGTYLSERTHIKPILDNPDVPPEEEGAAGATGATGKPTPAFASGTTYFGGGWAKVHKDEVVRLAAGPVYNARQSSRFAAATVVVNAVINNKLDEAQFAQMLRSAMRRAQVRA